MVGYVWPIGRTVFPDFFKERTQEWWINEIKNHHNNVLKFDGLWIVCIFLVEIKKRLLNGKVN
jgi:alpha-glucosidase (family GH31 glycosyl hydrolase)